MAERWGMLKHCFGRWWEWLRIRLPHVQTERIDPMWSHKFFGCWRLYGFRAYQRLVLIDLTWFRDGSWRLNLGPFRIYANRSERYSGPIHARGWKIRRPVRG